MTDIKKVGIRELKAWIREGTLVPPARPKAPLPPSPVRLPEGTASALLDRDRGEPTSAILKSRS